MRARAAIWLVLAIGLLALGGCTGTLDKAIVALGGDGQGSDTDGAIGAADGQTPKGVLLPVTSREPAVAKLDRALKKALRRAAVDASADGVRIGVTSGWRSTRLQNQLLQDAIAKYGSRAEAERWVATPRTSAHVAGDAVDVGPAAAMSWLQVNGWRYGLCQTYANERWHFELRTQPGTSCPPSYADPTQDPRTRR